MRIPRLFGESTTDVAASRLYGRAVGQARHPDFYLIHGVPDTPDGRFDMIALHVALVLRRLRKDHRSSADVAQALFDRMFADMDQNLREMGVGDIGVGKRVKAMAKAFYGRLGAYDAGLDSADDERLVAALRRNLYRKTSPRDDQVAAVAGYMRREANRLDVLAVARIIDDGLDFGPPPPVGGEIES